jgi:hypothetical protein
LTARPDKARSGKASLVVELATMEKPPLQDLQLSGEKDATTSKDQE